MSDYILSNGELYHYGVLGMKWGKRKARYDSEAKANYKAAKKAYNKAYNDAYNYSSRYFISQYTNKAKYAESNRRRDDATKKAGDLNKAKAEYKQAKSERRQKINSVHRDLYDRASFDERLFSNNATWRKAAKYVVDNNMSMADATRKATAEAKRNTAIAYGALAAVTISQLYIDSRR